jgi:methionyl-tRNA formyltransferase
VVACSDGGIEILELQREGKRRVSATDFLHGYRLTPGDRLS